MSFRLPSLVSFLCFLILYSCSAVYASDVVTADGITPDDSVSTDETQGISASDGIGVSGDELFEDSGNDIINTSGISSDSITGSGENESELMPDSGLTLDAADPDRIAETLQSLTLTESVTGTEGEMVTGEYIEEQMKALGYEIQEQAFHEGMPNDEGVDPPGINIIAERGANSQQSRTNDILLLVTHYDSKRNPSGDDPYANDKTGAAVLLESARILSSVQSAVDVCFLFLSGQEDGGYGAQRFIESLSDENRSRISSVIIAEKVGYDSGMPCVIGTAGGETGTLSSLVQQCGIEYDVDRADQSGQLDALKSRVLQAVSNVFSSADSGLSDGSGDAPQTGTVLLDWTVIPGSSLALSSFSSESFNAVRIAQYDGASSGISDTSAQSEAAASDTQALLSENTDAAADVYFAVINNLNTISSDVSEGIDSGDGMQSSAASDDGSSQKTYAPDPDAVARAADVVSESAAEIMQP